MIDPKYVIPSGMMLTANGKTQRIFPNAQDAYDLESSERGTDVVNYNQVVSALRNPDAWSTNMVILNNAASARIRSGGLFHVDQLKAKEQDKVAFRKALCIAISSLEREGHKLTQAYLNLGPTRIKIKAIAAQVYTKFPINTALRGGSVSQVACMPLGRTLLKYYKGYVESGFDEMALADQTWLRGNRKRRLSTKVLDLILQAIEEAFLDPRKRTSAAAYTRFTTLLAGENAVRAANGLSPLGKVSYTTVWQAVQAVSPSSKSIARDGIKQAVNDHTRGSTDTRALMLGEYAEVDECKLSLMTVSKKNNWYGKLSADEKDLLKEVDEIVHSRLFLVLIIDVASRMPLGWSLAEAPGAEATQAALRMAMREKTRERIVYGCEREPMPAIGIGMLKGDNGSGIRNVEVKSAAVGLNVQSIDARTYRGGDKPYIERMFGTTEGQLISLLHGYAGRRAGALPGYDPIKNGVLDCEELYGIITRYLVDEYPLQCHTGTTMMGRRPIRAAEEINEKYGAILPPTAHDFRIQLGFKKRCQISHEGVKVFGLPYNSPELQLAGEQAKGKATVFVDPDHIAYATVLLEGHSEPILADLSWTKMSDLTLKEFFTIAEAARAEDPQLTASFEGTLVRVRQKLSKQLADIASKHKLTRSFMTLEEADSKAKALLAGVHSPRVPELAGTTKPGSLSDDDLSQGAYTIGDGFTEAIELEADETDPDFLKNVPDIEGKLK